MVTNETEMVEFPDFTIAETRLWGENLRNTKFSDYPKVFRWVIAQMSSAIAQEVPAIWFAEFMAGEPEGEVIDGIAQGWEHPKKDKLGKYDDPSWTAWMLGKIGEITPSLVSAEGKKAKAILPTLQGTNLITYIEDALSEFEFVSGMELRRHVVKDLEADIADAAVWDLWLCHMAWMVERREAEQKRTAKTAWNDYVKDTRMEQSRAIGMKALMAWRMARMAEEAAEEDDEEGDDTDPLVETKKTDYPAVAGV